MNFLGHIVDRDGVSKSAEYIRAVTLGKRNEKLIWMEDMLQSFVKLKEIIQEEVKLAYPDYTITTDLFGVACRCLSIWSRSMFSTMARRKA